MPPGSSAQENFELLVIRGLCTICPKSYASVGPLLEEQMGVVAGGTAVMKRIRIVLSTVAPSGQPLLPLTEISAQDLPLISVRIRCRRAAAASGPEVP